MHVSFVFKLFDRVLKVVAVVVDTRLSEYLVESVNVVWKGEIGDKGMQTRWALDHRRDEGEPI